MPYNKEKHDLGILKQDAVTKVGLILARDKNKVPIYQTFADEYLAQQRTQEVGYGGLPPEKEIRIGQDSFRAGFGLETYDESDPERYFSSYNMDLRNRGMAICSYKPTTLTKPSVTIPTITNAEFEIDVSPTAGFGWTINTGDWTQSNAQNHTPAGTYSWKNTGCVVGEYIWQILTPAIKETTIIVKVWVYCVDGTDKIYLRLVGGGTTVDGTPVGTTGTWVQATATKTLTSTTTAFSVRIQVQAAAAGNDIYVDDATVSVTALTMGSTVCFAEFNDELYASFGKNLGKLNAAGTTFDLVGVMPAVITDLEVFSDNKLYIAQGYAAAYLEMTTAGAFTLNTLANNTMKFFAFVHTTVDTMYGADTANTIRSTTDPKDGGTAWSGQTTIDAASNDLTKLLSFDNALYMMKEDRPFYLDDSGGVRVLTNITRPIRHTDAGKNALEWGERIYMNWGTESLLEYDGGALSWLSPSLYCTNLGDFDGQVQALAADEEWLFAVIHNSTKMEVLAGRYEVVDGAVRWVWHPYAEITLTASTGCETAFVSNHPTSLSRKSLYIAPVASTESVYYIPLPQGYGDIANDDNRSFATDSSQNFITPFMHANFKGDSKAFIKMTLSMSGTTDNIYFTADYQLLGSTNWTTIGTFKTSPTTTNYIPVDDISSVNPVSTMIRFKITATTNSATTTPILYGYDCRGILYPTRRDIIYCEVRCANNITLNDGGQDRDTDAGVIKATLEEAKNTATWPVTMYEYQTGSTIYVRFLSGQQPFSRVVKDEVSGNFETRYYLWLQKVSLT